MCTAIHLCDEGLFGRTLDYEMGFGEEVVITPRETITMGETKNRYAMVGVGVFKEGATLYFDGMNEWGLCGAALNFPGYAVYQSGREDKASVPSGMILSFVLGFCKNINQIRDVFSNIGISDDALFNLPPASLHWIFADKTGAITVESTERGLEILDNPYGVLTNAPNFSYHTTRLGDYMALHSGIPKNRLSKGRLSAYSRGMGALGLPGDFSSVSRFVRGVFVKENSISDKGADGNINRMRHILSSVSIPLGCVKTDEGEHVLTRYSCIMDSENLTYYFSSYVNPRLRGVRLYPDNTEIKSFPIYEHGKNNIVN